MFPIKEKPLKLTRAKADCHIYVNRLQPLKISRSVSDNNRLDAINKFNKSIIKDDFIMYSSMLKLIRSKSNPI